MAVILQHAIGLVQEALMITAFVFVMMVVVEYANVWSGGTWKSRLGAQPLGQYLLAASLGVLPGCLGAFAVVAMYSRGAVTVGAVVAAMIATCGDEAFVILAVLPDMAVVLFAVLWGFGLCAGILTDAVLGRRFISKPKQCVDGEFHADLADCRTFPRGRILEQWRHCTPARGILVVVLVLFLGALLIGDRPLHEGILDHRAAGAGQSVEDESGRAGGAEHEGDGHKWDWIHATMALLCLVGLFIVSTVPDHFLEDHLWNHLARRHGWRIFLWTLGALVAIHLLLDRLDLDDVMRENMWVVLVIACLVGLIPESGPHLVFVLLFAQGSIPLSVLLAGSIVQDGHGMLPLLADSRRGFLLVKGINLLAGLGAGAGLLAWGL